MNKTEEKRHFEWTKLRIVIAVFVFVLLLLIWSLELNGSISRTLFYASSLAVILSAFLVNHFLGKKAK
jgi:hypothetical protein